MGKAITPEVETLFQRLVREDVHSPLREAGFRRASLRWTRDLQIVRVQRYSHGEPEVHFTVNVLDPSDPRVDPNSWGLRIGDFLPEPYDVWWTVKDGKVLFGAGHDMNERDDGLLGSLIRGSVLAYLNRER